MIVEEGSTVPADVRIICNYDNPEDFEKYLQMKEDDAFDDASDPDDEKEDELDEERPISQGHALVAVLIQTLVHAFVGALVLLPLALSAS